MRNLKLTIVLLLTVNVVFATKKIIIKNNTGKNSPRILFAIEKLASVLKKNGYEAIFTKQNNKTLDIISITINGQLKKEGFALDKHDKAYSITGADESGVLYGCLAFAEQLNKSKNLLPQGLFSDAPEMVLRGQCIGLQKSTYLPGRNVYEYPYTPTTFPWFYNKKLWLQVLDSMLDNRMNSLYLWNGHPFASLVKLKDYPYAVEVDDATFKKNEEMYRFITSEADKRGIWVIQMFYNIIVSKPFAEHHNIKTQERERPILPLIADYTRKSIAAFVEKYPNVGLMVCLGEAMEGGGNDDIEWFTKTIIPGVKDGLKMLGETEEPPIVLRAHDTDAPSVMKAALPLYKNLYTEAKFNGEALTTQRPRGQWAALHQTLSKLGSVQIENVHILANLEPFRYGSPDFIQQSVIGMHEVMGGNGLHLYPQASYWDWPYTADSVKARPDDLVGRRKRLLQIERDWIWYKAWSRYAWKAKRNRNDEINYWSRLLADKFGCSINDGKTILMAYEESGEIAPKLLRRFGITDGNRQTLTLGMLMTQLINPYRYGLFTLLYEDESPEGEMLIDYADKEWKKQKHIGETPVQIINEVKQQSDKAVTAIGAIEKKITRNKDEFDRLKNDMHCYKAMAYHFADKATAALDVLKYKYSGAVADLEKALPVLQQSVDHYKELVDLTKNRYLYANSMQTQQRKIPMRGVDGTFKHWQEMLPVFQGEVAIFKRKIDSLKNLKVKAVVKKEPFNIADVKWIDSADASYAIETGARIFSDTSLSVAYFADELKNLRGVKFSLKRQLKENTSVSFTSTKPVKVLVGYFAPQRAAFSKDTVFLKAPELETNASANDYGQAEVKIANALVIKGMPPVNIHSYRFDAGKNELKLGKGVCLVMGFVDGNTEIKPYDAALTENGIKKEIDWLFE
ncbi:alpha-d-galacturonidase [Terrimonas alba]|uniref:alpha-d-galacturonidase n=1 Tax=Terrimonas alba TaxID=3349636 RepID=UPI0035F473C4